MSGTSNLFHTYVRTRQDGSAEPLPVDEEFWRKLSAGRLGDFHGEQLIACHEMGADWTNWEMHPKGDELVCLLSGSVRLLVEEQGTTREFELTEPGAFVLVPAGCWHTAKVATPSRMLFVTPGEGTEHRAL